MRIVSIDQFAYYAIGGYLTYVVLKSGGYYGLGVVAAIVTAIGISIAIERLLVRQTYERELLFSMILTFGVLYVSIGIIKHIWGLPPRPLPAPIGGVVEIFGTTIPLYRVIITIISWAVYVFLMLFFKLTIVGKAIRAGVESFDKVEGLGVNIRRIFTFTFALAATLSALSGALHGPLIMLDPAMGLYIVPTAFMVVIIGGLGSVTGTFLSSLLVGQITSFFFMFFPPMAEVIPFIMMLFMFLFKPTGLLGAKYLKK